MCVLDCEWACVHGNDGNDAVARCAVVIHSPDALIYCENERLRERERIIMFPLLSRLPQLSLKRGRLSTCLLILLKLSNNRTPQFLWLYLSLSRRLYFFLLPIFSLFPIKLLVIPQYFFPLPLCLYQTRPPPTALHVFRLQPRLTSQLYRGLTESSLLSLLPFSLCGALLGGTGKRKNEETKHFRLYTARGKAVVWFPLCFVTQDCVVCLTPVHLCVCFAPSRHSLYVIEYMGLQKGCKFSERVISVFVC